MHWLWSETAGPLQLLVLLNQGWQLFCLLLPFIKSNYEFITLHCNFYSCIYTLSYSILASILGLFSIQMTDCNCIWVVCFFCTLSQCFWCLVWSTLNCLVAEMCYINKFALPCLAYTFRRMYTLFHLPWYVWGDCCSVQTCWSVLGHDTEPQIAPDGQSSTLHGSSLPSVCECVCEWVNEKQIVKQFR